MPWERRAELGLFPALLQTIGESLLHPVEFFRKVHPVGGIGPALVYAIAMAWTGVVFAILWNAVLPSWPGPFGAAEQRAAHGISVALVVILSLVVIPVVVPITVFIASLVYHGLLLLFGGPNRGFEGTVRTVAYATSPEILMIVPICGSLLAFAWGFVLTIIGLREMHGIQTGKAVAIVLVPYLLCGILVLGTIALMLMALPGGLEEILKEGSR